MDNSIHSVLQSAALKIQSFRSTDSSQNLEAQDLPEDTLTLKVFTAFLGYSYLSKLPLKVQEIERLKTHFRIQSFDQQRKTLIQRSTFPEFCFYLYSGSVIHEDSKKIIKQDEIIGDYQSIRKIPFDSTYSIHSVDAIVGLIPVEIFVGIETIKSALLPSIERQLNREAEKKRKKEQDKLTRKLREETESTISASTSFSSFLPSFVSSTPVPNSSTLSPLLRSSSLRNSSPNLSPTLLPPTSSPPPPSSPSSSPSPSESRPTPTPSSSHQCFPASLLACFHPIPTPPPPTS